MNYRLATPEDAPEIIRLAELFLQESIYGQLLEQQPKHMEHMVSLVFRHGVIFIATEGQKMVGMFAMVVVPHPLTGSSYAEEVVWFVDKAYRSGSVGPRLLAAGEAWATSNRVSMVKLVAPFGSDVGKHLERQGWTPVETAFVKRIEG